ncbi:hypothetical protein CBR_g34563 [Chara braunii]|uniref:Uncharacterized protein n=1 Tax=Chara braunii TaxID=69332 RepID=A0A388LIY4_CHABU|nr:hypothetical protein CBR_g34563 [Chara braunii]|eukprot:GBG82279.1 hypothetical protein CBR_g34563 [Chara braunii]
MMTSTAFPKYEHMATNVACFNTSREASNEKKKDESGESSKSTGTRKGKTKASTSSEDGENNLRNWLAENSGVSLKWISKKLNAVDKRTKEVDRQNEMPAKKIEDLESAPKKGEASSNKKRKCVVDAYSPATERQKSRSRLRSGGIKTRQPRIEVSSDEDVENGRAQNAIIEGPPPENKPSLSTVNLEDVMKMLAIIAGKTDQDRRIAKRD